MATETLLGIIGVIFASQGFWTWLMSRSNNKTAKDRIIMGLAYAEICRRAEHYIADGEISTDDYKDFEKYLYKPYKEMGGNGTAEKLMKEVEKLPIRKEDNHDHE